MGKYNHVSQLAYIARMTPEEREAYYARKRELARARYKANPERKRKQAAAWIAEMSPDKLAAWKQRRREADRRQYRAKLEEKRAKAAAKMQRLRERNPSKYQKIARRYRLKHADRINAALRRRNEEDLEYANRRRMHSAAWVKRNPEKARLLWLKRHWRHRCARGRATTEQIQARIAYYGGRCAYCSNTYEHLDHAIPLARGGTNWPANIRPACSRCNLTKGAHTVEQFQRLRATG